MSDCVLEIEKDAVFLMTGIDCTYVVGWINKDCIIGNDIIELWSLFKGEQKVAELEVISFVSAGLPEIRDNSSRITLCVSGIIDKDLLDFNHRMTLVRRRGIENDA